VARALEETEQMAERMVATAVLVFKIVLREPPHIMEVVVEAGGIPVIFLEQAGRAVEQMVLQATIPLLAIAEQTDSAAAAVERQVAAHLVEATEDLALQLYEYTHKCPIRMQTSRRVRVHPLRHPLCFQISYGLSFTILCPIRPSADPVIADGEV
jgi:hypothetical protein